MTSKGAAVPAAIACAVAAAAPAPAQPGMGMIGQRQVGEAADHDTIPVTGTDQYGTLMICVDRAPVHFQEVTVRFHNGTSRNIRLRSVIADGRCSREIELHGRGNIASVDFTYEAAHLAGQRARVQLYGR